jgi:16S rRNA processing protein RimM
MIGTNDPQQTEHSKDAQQLPEYLAVGRVIRPHGVRGALLVEPASDVIKSVSSGMEVYLGSDYTPFEVRLFSSHRQRFLLHLENLDTRENAEKYRGETLYIRFDDSSPLAEGVYYYWQLLGLTVYTEEGTRLGTVEEIIETGANDVYLVRTDEGNEILLPAIESVIQEVDLDQNRIIVHLLPGLLPDA